MNEKEIRSFSLESLLEMCGRRPGDFYYDGCLITSRVNTGDEVPMDLFRYPVRIDAFAVVFCSKGSISLLSNLTRYELGENSFFVHLPGSILHVESTPDAEIYVAACEEEFIRRIDVDIKLLSNLFLQLERYPLLQLEPGEWECVARSISEISDEGVPEAGDLYSTEIIRSAIRMLIYKVCRLIARHLEQVRELSHSPRSRREEYFQRFMTLLRQHYMRERSVGFYAAQLNLSPKYLTTLIRQTTGHTAINWIDDYVILEAKNMLRYSTMSIQEIAYCLNFSNQSFFGKYFKNHTGQTPSAYRMGGGAADAAPAPATAARRRSPRGRRGAASDGYEKAPGQKSRGFLMRCAHRRRTPLFRAGGCGCGAPLRGGLGAHVQAQRAAVGHPVAVEPACVERLSVELGRLDVVGLGGVALGLDGEALARAAADDDAVELRAAQLEGGAGRTRRKSDASTSA